MNEVVDSLKKYLLDKFHQITEEHLMDTERDKNSVKKHSKTGQLWVEFFNSAKQWLLSYSTVCLLPLVILKKSIPLIIEKYQESLDEALIPIWGRFYFHLQIAREAKTGILYYLSLFSLITSSKYILLI